MIEKPKEVPAPVSIQTGDQRVKKLIPIHEEAGFDVPATFKEFESTQSIPEENFPNEALQPPPYANECDLGNIGDLEPPPYEEQQKQKIYTGGTKFDPNSSMDSMQQKRPYHIIDLFWFISPKFSSRQELPIEEAHFCQVSFNIDFGNMKMSLFKIPNGALYGHVLFLMSLLRLTSGTIYPSSLFKLIHESERVDRKQPVEFTCLEQLVYNSGETWQTQRPVCSFTVGDTITLTINDKNSGKFFYEFTDWQKNALIHSAKFAINEGYALTGNQNIRS